MRLALYCYVDALDVRKILLDIVCKCAMAYGVFDMMKGLNAKVCLVVIFAMILIVNFQ